MSADPVLGIDCADAQQCFALLAGLPLTKPGKVQQILCSLLEGLARRPPPAPSYLQVLEMARSPLAFAQEEVAQRYAQRAVIPGSTEDDALKRVVYLWQIAARAYAQVAQIGGGSAEVQNRLAMICQRCIHYAGKPIFEYFRARRQLPKGLWIDLHGYYSTAEEWDLADMPVAEPLNEYSRSQSPAQAYAAVLLVDLGNPYGRSAREFDCLLLWAQRFALYTQLDAPEDGCDRRQFAVDLMRDEGPRPLELLEANENIRRVATLRLSEEMHEVVRRLKSGAAPSELGLGEKAAEPMLSRLMFSLYRPWCLASSPRRFPRRASSGNVAMGFSFEAIHYFVSGSEFIQPAHVRIYSRKEFETIVTFRHQVDPTEQLHFKTSQVLFPSETWSIADQSVSGLRLARRPRGERLEHDQLVALRPPDAEKYLLGQVRWLMYGTDEALIIGLQVLPGVPLAVSVRPAGPNVSRSELYSRAFLLPEMPALKEPESLVLPKGWYQPERVVEVFVEHGIEVRLTDVLTAGPDFDRVSFSVVRQSVELAPEPALREIEQ